MTAVELDRVANEVLSRVADGEEVEVYGLQREVTRAQAGTGGEVLNVGRAQTRGIGVRLLTADRPGYASTADLTDAGMSKCIEQARDNARTREPDPAERLPLPQPLPVVPELSSAEFAEYPTKDKVALVVELARRATNLDARVRTVDTATYRDERTTVLILSTAGVRAVHQRASAELSVDVVGDDGQTTAADYGHRVERSPGLLDVDVIAAEAVGRTVRLLGPRRPWPSDVPVLLDPEVTAIFLAAAGRGLTAGAIGTGRGPFSGATGRSAAAPCVTLVDDGLHPLAPATAPFDDEGVPRQRTTLIDRGVVTGMLHSTATAVAVNDGRSTGNARRGSHKSPPGVAPTTLLLTPTTSTEIVLGQTGTAVYVQQLSAGQSGVSAATGRVDVGAVAFALRDGEPAEALVILPLATSIGDVFRTVRAVGDDARAVPEQPVLAATLVCGAQLVVPPSLR